MDEAELPTDRLERAIFLMNLMAERATGTWTVDKAAYRILRSELMGDRTTASLLPRYVRTCRDIDAFWPIAKEMDPTWAGRRHRINEDFAPLFDALEQRPDQPVDAATSAVLGDFSAGGVLVAWQKALSRRDADPEGAITAARTLLETVCKHLLDEAGVTYSDADDLPKLYRLTSELLNLSPGQHTEDVFRRILGGCASVIEGLGALRNKVGDAHGHGPRRVRPLPRHAQLAVNLAGAMATFMVETWSARSGSI